MERWGVNRLFYVEFLQLNWCLAVFFGDTPKLWQMDRHGGIASLGCPFSTLTSGHLQLLQSIVPQSILLCRPRNRSSSRSPYIRSSEKHSRAEHGWTHTSHTFASHIFFGGGTFFKTLMWNLFARYFGGALLVSCATCWFDIFSRTLCETLLCSILLPQPL